MRKGRDLPLLPLQLLAAPAPCCAPGADVEHAYDGGIAVSARRAAGPAGAVGLRVRAVDGAVVVHAPGRGAAARAAWAACDGRALRSVAGRA
eukprot:gene36696-45085_t